MNHHHIMIVEDEADLRDTLKDLLEMQGYHVLTASNGREGLKLLQENRKFCLILLDLMMPVMNGWEFLDALKNEHQNIYNSDSVTVISAAADLTGVQQQYGCSALQKPVDIMRLLKLADEHCASC